MSHELFHQNSSCVPIWRENESHGHTGCMMWPGSNYAYNGRYCSHYQELDRRLRLRDRMKIVMGWILHKTMPANLIMWYFDQPDDDGHSFSPSSSQVWERVHKLDEFMGYLLREIEKLRLEGRTNLIIISDHGMVGVSPENIIPLTSYLTRETYDIIGDSPTLQVVPKAGYFNQVYRQLNAAAASTGLFKVYTNENLPPEWHMNNEKRVQITVVAKIYYVFDNFRGKIQYFKDHKKISSTSAAQFSTARFLHVPINRTRWTHGCVFVGFIGSFAHRIASGLWNAFIWRDIYRYDRKLGSMQSSSISSFSLPWIFRF